VLDREKARRAAEEFLRKVIQPRVAEELVIAELEEFPTCWVADYTTRKFMQAGSLRHALAASSPRSPRDPRRPRWATTRSGG
jgi:Immunity protein 35